MCNARYEYLGQELDPLLLFGCSPYNIMHEGYRNVLPIDHHVLLECNMVPYNGSC